MKRYYWLAVIGVVLVAAFLRLYRLAEVPAGMTWDEAAIGYNGYAIWETRRDEWVRFLPISFQSFGDYKAPFAIYLNGFFTFLFGLNLWAVRLPFALSGVMAVLGLGFLVRRLWQFTVLSESYLSPETASIIGMIMMALSPWHLHFSRIGFESGLALTEIIWATYFLVMYLSDTRRSKIWDNVLLAGSVVGYALSFYTYHSAKIVTPLLVLTLLGLFKERVAHRVKPLLVASVGGVLLLLPFVKDSLFGAGAERFSQATVFGQGLGAGQITLALVKNFLIHFTPAFLIFGQTETLRHGPGAWSVLLPTTFILVILGVVASVWRPKTQKLFSLATLSLVWIVIGLLPAAIGRDVPHSNRALLALPGVILLALQGLEWLLKVIEKTSLNQRVVGNHNEKNILVTLALGYYLISHCLLFGAYHRYYYSTFARESTDDFQEGYLEMLAYVLPYEKGEAGAPEVSKIRISDEYGQPYIYTLFSRQTNPIWYQGGSLIKYEFGNVEIGDLLRKNAIVVGSARDANDLPFERADTLIYGSDGSVRFAIFLTQP